MNEGSARSPARCPAALEQGTGHVDGVRLPGRGIVLCLWASLLVFPAALRAQTILDAGYDPAADAIVLEIAYQGTHPDHRFRLDWEECHRDPDGSNSTVARLVDQDGGDFARDDYEVTRRFGVSALACRPAEVTVRLGPVSNRTISVPAPKR